VTLTMPTIRTADEVWLIASGPDKAGSVGRALNGTGDLPAGRARGASKTFWLLDRAAAAEKA
jgi:6-phosphogluconolactonase